jgi:hypothetical protein
VLQMAQQRSAAAATAASAAAASAAGSQQPQAQAALAGATLYAQAVATALNQLDASVPSASISGGDGSRESKQHAPGGMAVGVAGTGPAGASSGPGSSAASTADSSKGDSKGGSQADRKVPEVKVLQLSFKADKTKENKQLDAAELKHHEGKYLAFANQV